jgi:arginyl-tRNA synthetase
MNLESQLIEKVNEALEKLFTDKPPSPLKLQATNKEFEGSHTLVCFPLTKISKKNPEETASILGDYLVEHSNLVSRYNVVKGFLNLVLKDSVWVNEFINLYQQKSLSEVNAAGKEVIVEYSSPNTNKPLHLGHLRNNFLGWSVAAILEATGHRVHKVQVINDRGIHICKSMAAWKKLGNGENPESSGLKGDKLVGKYYVEFDKAFKKETAALIEKGLSKEEAEKQAPIMREAIDMLRKWEQKDEEVMQLWETMNNWVYQGFDVTYKQMGVDFEKLYYESNTYLLGKEEVLKGVESGVFFQKEDGSVWVDLTADGLDQKVLLRSDGTSVYMTQDIGTAILRSRDFPNMSSMVYTVGNEQDYHFKVLFLILKKLGYAWASDCYHLSYGMVDLPSGKMKSREGTVVDADDLMAEMVAEAEKQTRELGKIEDLSDVQAKALYNTIGMGALKYFLLKVDPRKRMLFDPNESIQLQGHTGPFIQYTHARIRALLRKAKEMNINVQLNDLAETNQLLQTELEVLVVLSQYKVKLQEAAKEYSPAVVSNFVFDLAKEYNRFYQEVPVFNESDQSKLKFRIAFSEQVARTIQHAMGLLGIHVPEKM